MKVIAKLTAAALFTGVAGVAQAAEPFAGITLGKASDNIRESSRLNAAYGHPDIDGVINKTTSYGVRFGGTARHMRSYVDYDNASDSKGPFSLRQENLLASYDLLFPVADQQTRAFAGFSAGVTKVSQESSGFHRDSDYSWAAGLQAGIIHNVSDNLDMELGYRYLRTGAKNRLSAKSGIASERFSLHSSERLFLGITHRF